MMNWVVPPSTLGHLGQPPVVKNFPTLTAHIVLNGRVVRTRALVTVDGDHQPGESQPQSHQKTLYTQKWVLLY